MLEDVFEACESVVRDDPFPPICLSLLGLTSTVQSFVFGASVLQK